MLAAVDVLVDARGSDCPTALMEMIRAVQSARTGQVVAALSDDAMARVDIPLWVEKSGNELMAVTREADCDEFIVRKAKPYAADAGR